MTFFTKLQGSAGCGGANLSDPRGGLAKGTPRKTATDCVNPSKLMYFPRTLPCRVSTTGGDDGCPDENGVKIRTQQSACLRAEFKGGCLLFLGISS